MRDQYYDQLDSIVDDLVAMTAAVQTAVHEATEALLSADPQLAESVISGDKEIDDARELIEERTLHLLATQQPVATDLRTLVATLRLVSDLERMGDMSVHIAKVARRRMPEVAVPEALESTFRQMARVGDEMIGAASRTVADRDADAAEQLEVKDDEMDRLHRSLFRTVLSDDWRHGIEPAIDIALLGRYYERIGDHAVSIARRVAYLVTGERT